MSQLEGTAKINFAAGLEWHAALNLQPRLHPGPEVIFEAGPALGGPRFSVTLTETRDLVLVVTDANGIDHSTPPVSGALLEKPVHLVCAVCPVGGGEFELGVFINNARQAVFRGKADLNGPMTVLTSIGTNVRGEHPAAFQLAEMAMYNSCTPTEARSRLHGYFKARYALA
jgi:hypothetical protein